MHAIYLQYSLTLYYKDKQSRVNFLSKRSKSYHSFGQDKYQRALKSNKKFDKLSSSQELLLLI